MLRTKLSDTHYTLLYLCGVAAWSVLLVLYTYRGLYGVDFEPVYFGARRILQGKAIYGTEAARDLMAAWGMPWVYNRVALSYPMPFYVLHVPFVVLPVHVAIFVWTGLGAFGSLLVAKLDRAQVKSMALLPFLFSPFFLNVQLSQPTLLMFACATGLVLATRAKHAPAIGLLCAILLLKPQNGLLFALAGCVWSALYCRRAIVWFVVANAVLWGVSFLVNPMWVQGWIGQLQLYNGLAQPINLLPLGLLLVITCHRLPWWAQVAALQVVLFPVSYFYSTLPLLLCWAAVGGSLALIGSSFSLLYLVTDLSIEGFWLLCMYPLMVASSFRALRFYSQRRAQAQAT